MGRGTKYHTQEERKAARREQRLERSLMPGYVPFLIFSAKLGSIGFGAGLRRLGVQRIGGHMPNEKL